VYQTLRVKTLLSIFILITFPCVSSDGLKFSEIHRVTGATGVVRGSFPLVEESCVFCPLLNLISNNK
jgi:hypothetical protein